MVAVVVPSAPEQADLARLVVVALPTARRPPVVVCRSAVWPVVAPRVVGWEAVVARRHVAAVVVRGPVRVATVPTLPARPPVVAGACGAVLVGCCYRCAPAVTRFAPLVAGPVGARVGSAVAVVPRAVERVVGKGPVAGKGAGAPAVAAVAVAAVVVAAESVVDDVAVGPPAARTRPAVGTVVARMVAAGVVGPVGRRGATVALVAVRLPRRAVVPHPVAVAVTSHLPVSRPYYGRPCRPR